MKPKSSVATRAAAARPVLAAAGVIAVLLVTACGQKGPLYLPTAAAPASAPASAPAR